MFRRLEEAWRLYRIQPKPIVISGGHVNPFTPDQDENKIARDYLIGWGVPTLDVLGEDQSRDTFESAVNVAKLLREKGWKRYLLVTSAVHMPRSMLAFASGRPSQSPLPAISPWETGSHGSRHFSHRACGKGCRGIGPRDISDSSTTTGALGFRRKRQPENAQQTLADNRSHGVWRRRHPTDA
jgi:hypothetical protein